jgi:hypothetical protein
MARGPGHHGPGRLHARISPVVPCPLIASTPPPRPAPDRSDVTAQGGPREAACLGHDAPISGITFSPAGAMLVGVEKGGAGSPGKHRPKP